MCGITGFWNRNGAPADAAIVRRMTDALVHRGPDDVGHWTDGAVALGHRRLSIIDVRRGRQPMELANEPDLRIVYNGEVYNHVALRGALQRSPDAYRTHCDTETVLAAWRERGAESLHALRGMFAFAVHDRRARALFLARDRLGIKPLYYHESPDLFAFASEIKALLAHPAVEARVNESRLPVQLSLKYTLDDQTLFAGIRKLLPGHWLRVDRSGLALERYWDLHFEDKTPFASLDEAAAEFGQRFDESVSLRLMSDVPLGVFLSGGIDSSAIAASMARSTDEPIRSFSVAFARAGFDEREHARAVAKHVGSVHREVVPTEEEWFRAWPRMIFHEDEPLAHPSSISLHFVSKLAAEDVKVVLTGEGADELLGGYERYYQTLVNLRAGRFVPSALRRSAAAAIDLLPDTWRAKRKAMRTSLYLESDIATLFLDNYAAFSRKGLRSLLRAEWLPAVEACHAPFEELLGASDARAPLDQILYADIKTYLLELLMKQDQMSMSASIESRVPFLDHELVEFVCRLPVEYKLQGFQTKRVLRRAVSPWLPAGIATRPKMGFPTPTREWFRGRWHQAMRELLLSRDSRIATWIEPSETRRLLDWHAEGRGDFEEAIWTLANLELWTRIFIDGRNPDDVWVPHATGSQGASAAVGQH